MVLLSSDASRSERKMGHKPELSGQSVNDRDSSKVPEASRLYPSEPVNCQLLGALPVKQGLGSIASSGICDLAART